MLLGTLAFIALGLHTVLAARVPVQHNGRTLTLGEISYFVPPAPVSALHDAVALSAVKGLSGDTSSDLVPFSLIPTAKSVFDEAALQETVETWSGKDDVWSESFLAGRPTLHVSSRTSATHINFQVSF